MINQAAPQIPIVPDLSLRAERVLAGLYALRAITERLASLTLEEDLVRRFILNIYPQLGRAPKRQEIESAFPQHAVEHIDRICRRLHEKDIVYIPEGSYEIAGAYPFTDLRNNHSVKFQWQEKHRSVYAMCAIDALGIPFMYNTNADIRSSCAHCETEINLSVHDQAITAVEPPGTMVSVGLSCARSAATSLCTMMLFFCCEAHSETWRAARENPAGETLTLGESLAIGKDFFGDRLQTSEFWKERLRIKL